MYIQLIYTLDPTLSDTSVSRSEILQGQEFCVTIRAKYMSGEISDLPYMSGEIYDLSFGSVQIQGLVISQAQLFFIKGVCVTQYHQDKREFIDFAAHVFCTTSHAKFLTLQNLRPARWCIPQDGIQFIYQLIIHILQSDGLQVMTGHFSFTQM